MLFGGHQLPPAAVIVVVKIYQEKGGKRLTFDDLHVAEPLSSFASELSVKSSACLSAAMPATSPSPCIPAYLESITKEAATCTLLTKDGGKVEVQAHLLSALSPFLACLIAQVGAIRSKREFSVNAKNCLLGQSFPKWNFGKPLDTFPTKI